jgi:hypothetical protein
MEVVTVKLVVALFTVALDIGRASPDRVTREWPRGVLMEEDCRGHHQLRIIIQLLVQRRVDGIIVKHLDQIAQVHLRKT